MAPSRVGRYYAAMVGLVVRTEEKDEAKRMEVEHQKKVSRMIKSADGSAGLLQNNYQANGVERSRTDPEEEDAKPLARCEEKRKE